MLSSLVLAAAVSTVAAQKESAPVYTQVASVDAGVGGQPFRSLAFDAKANRLYAGSDRGLFWVNVNEAKPVWKGPMFKQDITHIEFAPELNRVFFTTVDDVGYVNTNALGEPKLIANVRASDMAYEPTRREIYVTSRSPRVEVFDGATGEPGAVVELPGWLGYELEAIPGRVFLQQGKTPGIFSIDAKTHALAAFPTSGKVNTPAHLEADPAGKYLFVAYYQNIVALDAASGKVLGRAALPSTARIAFDPGAGLLVATWADEPTPVRVAAFRVDAKGLIEVSQFKNPRVGGIGVEPTSHGFIQVGVNRLYIWSTSPGPA
jgi:hypothetical protein